MKVMPLFFFSLSTLAAPALAVVNINSPSNGDSVSSPFTLTADASTCSSERVDAITYSLDNGADLDAVNGTFLEAKVSAGLGAHIVHVKAWGTEGALCVSEIKVTVTNSVVTDESGSEAASEPIPSGASVISSIQTHANWNGKHDTGTPGNSSGQMSIVHSPSRSGAARKFTTHFSGSGGERYSDSFGEDTGAMNFVYEGWVYIAGSPSNLGNIELDLNQTLSNGDVMIYAFQCSGNAGVWEYGSNAGSVGKPKAKWIHSKISCDPRKWTGNTWHHVQIAYSRDNSGYITYQSLTFDATLHLINARVFGRFGLSWGRVLQTNFQIDGIGSGTNTAYLDDLSVYRW
jgi:hypothetical protein